jgi:hypothetical protein
VVRRLLKGFVLKGFVDWSSPADLVLPNADATR